MSDAVRTCPACSGSNPADRELCGTCGVDLFSGAELPRQTRGEAPDPPRRTAAPREHHRWVVPVVAVALGALLLVGIATWAGFGPLADAVDVGPAEFDPERYAADPGALRLRSVAASSAADGAPPSAVTDGDPTTAWRTAGPPASEEASEQPLAVLEFGLEGAVWIERMVLRNGDQQDGDAYADTARIARMRITSDAGEQLDLALLDLGLQAQEAQLPEPLLATELRVEVLEVFPGTEDGPIAFSELELVGWEADPDDAEMARDRRDSAPTRLEAPAARRAR